jgi:hypothetical protein
MKVQRAGLAVVAVAAFLSLPVLAEGVSTGTGGTVSSGTGLTVAPATASVTVIPSTSSAIPTGHLMPGGAMVQRSSTTVLGGPAGDVSGSQTIVTNYWVNVPPSAEHRSDFRRWQSLK